MVCQNCFTHIADGLDKCPVCDNDPTKKEGGSTYRLGAKEILQPPSCSDQEFALPPLDNKGVFILAVMAGACCAKGTAAEAAEIVVRGTTIKRKCFQSVNKGDLEARAIGFLSWFYSASVNAALPSWIEFETGEGE